jgi:hypothetical protein
MCNTGYFRRMQGLKQTKQLTRGLGSREKATTLLEV